ncbi:MAG: hypothetical protein VYD00_08365, partial [Pseudomonadota bacterium]|nr:hypothetical protein [Pseudomonadota bacterium]
MAGSGAGLDRLGLARLDALPERPLRLLPRWLGIVLLILTGIACIGNAVSLQTLDKRLETLNAVRSEDGARVDMDLYRTINARVAAGEDYYEVATDEHRRTNYPTAPFVTVRTPVLAWTTALWGAAGWRAIAILLWVANILAWHAALAKRGSRFERMGAAGLVALFGVVALIPEIATSHEALAGLMISLALALSERLFPAALALAVCASALRLLAVPFLLLWTVLAISQKRWSRAMALGAALVVLAIGVVLHANAVAAARLPGDLVSDGWQALIGPALPLYGINLLTILQELPAWIAGPLGVLPLLGWAALGGRMGTLAFGWFLGFGLFVALFARLDNFYWMGLVVPAYGVGLVFVPRAIGDALSRRGISSAAAATAT